MESKEHIEKVVKILDALTDDDLGDEENPHYVQYLHLTLEEVGTKIVFQARLEESDVRKIIRAQDPLTSKQMIDLAAALKNRIEPLKLLVPSESKNISVDDILKSRNLDNKNQTRRRRRSSKRKGTANNINS